MSKYVKQLVTEDIRKRLDGVSDAVLAESLDRMINGVLLRQQAAS